MKHLKNLVSAKWLCTLFVLLLICLPLQANPAAGPIVPGKSVGKVELGMTQQQIESILGKPSTTEKYHQGYGINVCDYDTDYPNTSSVYYKEGKAFYIEIRSPRFVAPGDITTRSQLALVIARHHKLKVSAFRIENSDTGIYYHDSYYYDDISAGITFGVWVGGHYDHSHLIDVIGIHHLGGPMPIPIYGTIIEPTLNKPPKPTKIPTGPDSPFSKDGLPLTEHVTPGGGRGYTTKPIIMPNSVSFLGTAVTSYQGKHVSAVVMLTFVSYSQTARWLGETHVTFTFAGRRLELQGVKSTEQTKNGLIVEELDVKVPVKDFLEIAKGSNLYFEIGGSRFMIGKKYLAGLRALRAKVVSK